MPISDSAIPVKDLEGLLQQTLGSVTVDKVDWKNLTNPGENYGSLILAVNATVSQKSGTKRLHLVVKLPPPTAWLQDLFNSPFTFIKELQFYRDVTPVFLTFERENGTKNPEDNWLGARYFGGRLGLEDPDKFDDQAAIVLQNLNVEGFTTIDRLLGLNLKQCEFAVRRLARLHALTIALREKKPQVFEDVIVPSLCSAINETAQNCVVEMQQKAAEDLQKIPGAEKWAGPVRRTFKFGEEAMQRQMETPDPPSRWHTMIHNDFWVNNMMFKSDEAGTILDMKIVDFQLTFYDYGVKDLLFFLLSSPTVEVIDESFDHLVDEYFEGFVEVLKEFKVDSSAFPKSEFMEMLNECGPLKFDQCLMMIQVIKSKRGVAPKMEDLESSESFLSIGGGEAYQRRLLHTVEFFDKRGWLK